MVTKLTDITPRVDLTRERGTGPVRTRRPIYVDLKPSCNHACPAGENIQAWLDLAQAGKYREAWEVLVQDNPMPAVHGRVCYHPCEDAWNRGGVDAPVSMHAVERFLGDLAAKENWQLKIDAASSGKKILIVGAGPCGLSAAYQLVRARSRGRDPGRGALTRRDGPHSAFRPIAYPARSSCGRSSASRRWASKSSPIAKSAILPGQRRRRLRRGACGYRRRRRQARRHPERATAARMLDAVNVLHETSAGHPPLLGRRVVVYGGGNTAAMDAARTAKRLGATETVIIYGATAPICRHIPSRQTKRLTRA